MAARDNIGKAIRETRASGRPAMIAYLTAGFPTKERRVFSILPAQLWPEHDVSLVADGWNSAKTPAVAIKPEGPAISLHSAMDFLAHRSFDGCPFL